MSNVHSIRRNSRSVPSTKRIEELAVAAGTWAATKSPVAVAAETGISVEKVVLSVVFAYQDRMGQLFGFASRREVSRLNELVRSLEYRLERIEGTVRRDPVSR
jgi:hypothetical protein